jgi:nitrogen regulatory protein P-II 1
MSQFAPTYLTDAVLITGVVERGRGDEVIKAAREAGAAGAILYHARGVGARERLGILAIAVEADKDVVTVMIPADQQEFVMQHIYSAAGLDRPGGGMLYAMPLDKVATYIPEEMRTRLEGTRK